MKFLIKPVDDEVKQMYVNHSIYHASDSGLDLFIVADEVIPAGETRLVDLGISCQLCGVPSPHDGKTKYYSYNMYSRSSISKTPLRLANGVGLCDAGYLGPLKAALHNTGTTDYTVKKSERYVQLARPDLEEVSFELVDDFGRTTTRGYGGFGSTLV
jgi:dUTP pyrophosphatase